MSNVNLKWAVLFVILILLPASILTYLSMQAFQDDRRSALADLNVLVPLLQEQFDRRLDAIVEQVGGRQDVGNGRFRTDVQGVVQMVTLGEDGQFVWPRFMPLVFFDRRQAFEAIWRRGEGLEFQTRDLEGARAVYQVALGEAERDGERVEVLNALGRVAMRLDDLEEMEAIHGQLKAYPLAFDADGAHPLSLSTLRLVQALPFDRAVGRVQEWLEAVRGGVYPIYPGSRQVLAMFRERVGKKKGESQVQWLDKMEALMDLVMVYPRLHKAGLGRREQVFLSGMDESGQSYLVYLHPGEGGQTRGLSLDLEALREALLHSPTGIDLQNRGFQLALFDVDYASNFEQQHGEVVHLIASASPSLYRMSLGFYSSNEEQMFAHYRQQNFLILGGILVLAGIIVLGVTMIFRDTTREVQLARLRSEFVSNVSHELRTPLTSIRMYAETLLMGRYRDAEQMQGYLETVMQESQRLSRMVGNILDFSRMESGRKTYEFEVCDPGELIRETVAEFDPVMEEQGFERAVRVPSDLPKVRLDREAVGSALANLISNAMKYSQAQKAIAVSACVEEGWLQIEVADRGIGVPVEDQKAIFGKFHRASNAGSAATGTGLGLSLVKGILDAHGGQVAYRSRDGVGSVFVLSVPIFEA